jgi:hypothetical protein
MINTTPPSRQRYYALWLAFGACILIFRTVSMMKNGALAILVPWVGGLTVLEFLVDVSVLVTSLRWAARLSSQYSLYPLRLGACTTFLHAFRVAIFVLGRIPGPWEDFDVRVHQRESHSERWKLWHVYFAATLSVLSVAVVIALLLLRSPTTRKKQE